MDTCTITDAAERTGFTASTLRYYERTGLVVPDRTAAGYRVYGAPELDTLRFIGRAKAFGLRLDEIADLVALLAADECAPVQERMQALVGAKILDAQDRIAELVAFTAELQRAVGGLSGHTADGPCDDRCGCTSTPIDTERPERAGVALVTKPGGATRAVDAALPAIACTLAPDAVDGRLLDWRTTLGHATAVDSIDRPDGPDGEAFGLCFHLPSGTDVGHLASLAAAEQACCSFFTFTVTIRHDGVDLEIAGPVAARPLIEPMRAWASAA